MLFTFLATVKVFVKLGSVGKSFVCHHDLGRALGTWLAQHYSFK